MTDNDFAQLSALQDYHAIVNEREHLKTIRFQLWHFGGFSIDNVVRYGSDYRVNLLHWPTRTRYGSEPLRTQSALERRVAKAGYVLMGYSDKADDMHIIVGESAKGVQK